jgi:hypothetical protein
MDTKNQTQAKTAYVILDISQRKVIYYDYDGKATAEEPIQIFTLIAKLWSLLCK